MSMKSLFAAIGLAVSILLPAASAQDQDLSVLAGQTAAAAPSEVLHAWLMDEVREATERRDAAYEKIKTPEEIAAYQKRMRDFFVEQLGGFPDRTPLNARVVGREQRDGYRIEKVIFESQPKHLVTAILYLPEVKPPFPGVLVPCGHSA
ncbi:MAG: alpha/beta hydrolase family protein, partial [Pirellulales bacterium]|nr:alpha/beta hydrolase family protein [Pirellulales bacterium]